VNIEEDLRSWSEHLLEVPSVHLNGLPPCPFARKAWAENQVRIIETQDVLTSALLHRDLVTSYDLVVIASYNIPDPELMEQKIEAYNNAYAKDDLYFMLFHPEYGAEEAELDFLYDTDWVSNIEDEYCMIFIQSLSKVDDASLQLEKKGYYDAFPKDEYETLVLNRRKRRNDEATSND
jgi:hypothetical protein